MAAINSNPPGIFRLLRKVMRTGWDTIQNRSELFLVELQEEKNRAIELFIWAGAVCFLGVMFMVVLTATVILIFPDHLRVYAAGGFCVLYLAGAILALLNLKALVQNAALPFSDTVAEVRKDREWLDSLK